MNGLIEQPRRKWERKPPVPVTDPRMRTDDPQLMAIILEHRIAACDEIIADLTYSSTLRMTCGTKPKAIEKLRGAYTAELQRVRNRWPEEFAFAARAVDDD